MGQGQNDQFEPVAACDLEPQADRSGIYRAPDLSCCDARTSSGQRARLGFSLIPPVRRMPVVALVVAGPRRRWPESSSAGGTSAGDSGSADGSSGAASGSAGSGPSSGSTAGGPAAGGTASGSEGSAASGGRSSSGTVTAAAVGFRLRGSGPSSGSTAGGPAAGGRHPVLQEAPATAEPPLVRRAALRQGRRAPCPATCRQGREARPRDPPAPERLPVGAYRPRKVAALPAALQWGSRQLACLEP